VTFEVVGGIEQVETVAAGPVSTFGRLLGQAMKRPVKQSALCLKNAGNEASLLLGKVYRILPDARAAI
jgi:hypothetical protein